MTIDSQSLSVLRELLTTRLDGGELRDLCFDLGIDYEILQGDAKADKVRSLIIYQVHRNQYNVLLSRLKQKRPDVPWPGIEQSQPIPEASEIHAASGIISDAQPSNTPSWKPWGAIVVAIVVMVAILGIVLSLTQISSVPQLTPTTTLPFSSAPQITPTSTLPRIEILVSDADDEVDVDLNGMRVTTVRFGDETHWVDVSRFVSHGRNTFTITTRNAIGPCVVSFDVKINDRLRNDLHYEYLRSNAPNGVCGLSTQSFDVQ